MPRMFSCRGPELTLPALKLSLPGIEVWPLVASVRQLYPRPTCLQIPQTDVTEASRAQEEPVDGLSHLSGVGLSVPSKLHLLTHFKLPSSLQ